MKHSSRISILVILLVLAAAMPWRGSPAEGAPSGTGAILAEKIEPASVAAGDRIVIVHHSGIKAVSTAPSGNYLAAAEVEKAQGHCPGPL